MTECTYFWITALAIVAVPLAAVWMMLLMLSAFDGPRRLLNSLPAGLVIVPLVLLAILVGAVADYQKQSIVLVKCEAVQKELVCR